MLVLEICSSSWEIPCGEYPRAEAEVGMLESSEARDEGMPSAVERAERLETMPEL